MVICFLKAFEHGKGEYKNVHVIENWLAQADYNGISANQAVILCNQDRICWSLHDNPLTFI